VRSGVERLGSVSEGLLWGVEMEMGLAIGFERGDG
jgi:hypothetical protein